MADFTLSNSTYDKLKKTTQLVLPAIGSLYFGLSTIWDLPAGEEVVGSLAVLATFFGTVLGVSSKNYTSNDEIAGDFVVDTTPDGKKVVHLQLEQDPAEIINGDKIVFNVVDTQQVESDEFWEADQNDRFDKRIAD